MELIGRVKKNKKKRAKNNHNKPSQFVTTARVSRDVPFLGRPLNLAEDSNVLCADEELCVCVCVCVRGLGV